MEAIVVGIMHYINATFHVDLMYGSEVVNQNLSNLWGFLFFFQQKKSNYFVTNQDIENL